MQDSPISKRDFVLISVISLCIISVIVLFTVFDSSTKIVFCDVGQGDAAYIRVRNKVDILIDAGPNRAVLSCLGRHMPFYDRTIEYAILSHHDTDHYGGYLFLLNRYKINTFFTPDILHPTKTYHKLLSSIKSKHIPLYFPKQNEVLTIDDTLIEFLWPPVWLNSQSVFAKDSNVFSLIFLYKVRSKKFLFTGDSPSWVLNKLTTDLPDVLHHIDILKVPHHGSKYGLTRQFLELAVPRLSVISVGKNNSYGHPAKEVLEMFKALKLKYVRTDEKGDITFKLPN